MKMVLGSPSSRPSPPRRRRIVRRFLGLSCVGDWRTRIEQYEAGTDIPSPLGERVRVREVVKTNQVRPGRRFLENRMAKKIPLRSAFASGYGATAPKRPAAL